MKRLILLVLLLLILFAATAVPTLADGSVFFSGTLDLSSPALVDRPDFCGGLYGGSGPFYYTTQTVNISDATFWGFYDFHSWVDVILIVYPEGGFDPLNPLANCVAVVDDFEQGLPLAPGSYTFVTTSYSDGETGSYEFAFGYPGLGGGGDWIDILPDGRPNDDANGCTQIANDPDGYLYDYEEFIPEISGVYTYYDLFEEEGTIDIWFSIYQGGFEPVDPLANCLANFDDDGQIYLQAGVSYIIMISTLEPGEPCGCSEEYGFAFLFMTLGGGSASVDACIYPLPSTAVVYQIPAGAPAFYQPDLATQLPWNLPAGTWYITDFSGDFARVWIACTGQQIWVPTNAVYIP